MSLDSVTPDSDPSNVTRNDVTRNGALSNAERQKRWREKHGKPLRKNSKAKDGKGPKPRLPTPRLYAPPPTEQRYGDYPAEIIDDILRRVSHGETLTQACKSTPGYPHPASIIDWTIEDPAGLGQRYARARDRQLERWADDLVDTSAEALADPGKAPGARLVLDAKKFLLSKLKPQVYGDHAKLDLTTNGQSIAVASSLDLAKALAAALQARALPAPEAVIDVEATEVPVEPEVGR
jgi:hypothetical protein